MPTFFTKVFSRGKDKEKEKDKDGLKEPASPTPKQSKRASIQSLLEGKFEAVSPTVSPSVQKFEEREKNLSRTDSKEAGKVKDRGRGREKDKDTRPALFRSKSRTAKRRSSAGTVDVPQLSLDLNLPSTREVTTRRDFDLVVDGGVILDDTTLGTKRLSADEALKLMRACASVIVSRGLESLGVMHPHWHSASPAVQRKIISLFLSSLESAPGTDTTPKSPTASAAAAFDLELEYARSPHDVSAVFRWALRHLQLEGDVFSKDNGNDSDRLGWYNTFVRLENGRSYPSTAYGELLVPAVKPKHVELLNATLGLVSSLASHSEINGVSGRKLTMSFGHYLLTGNKIDGTGDWKAFYSQWERAGRALEHIFLASLRDEASRVGIPKRLSELITNYPSKAVTNDQFPRPSRFATRSYDALYVQIAVEQMRSKRPEENLTPTRLLESALKAEIAERTVVEGNNAAALWEEVKKVSSATPEDNSLLSKILSDETLRLLSLSENSSTNNTPRITMFSPIPEHEDIVSPTKVANGAAPITKSTSARSTATDATVTPTWSQFSSSGFGETTAPQSLALTLLDTDVEKTEPVTLTPRRSLKRKNRSPTGQKERSARPPPPPLVAPSTSEAQTQTQTYRTVHAALVKIDEAFIDFWADALTDASVTRAWPSFAVYQLRTEITLPLEGESSNDIAQKLGWLVVEARTVEPAPVPVPESEPTSPVRRASSPRPSERSEKDRSGVIGRVSATFGNRKRFNFFGGSDRSLPTQTSSAGPTPITEKRESKTFTRVGELGEVIPEEPAEPVKAQADAPAPAPAAASAPATEEGKKDIAEVTKPAEGPTSQVEESTNQPGEDVTIIAENAAIAEAVEKMVQTPVPEPQAEVAAETKETSIVDAEPEHEIPKVDAGATEPILEEPTAAAIVEPAEPAVAETLVTSATTEVPEETPEPVSAVVKEASPEAVAEIPVAAIASKAVVEEVEPTDVQAAFEREGRSPGAGDSRFVEHVGTPSDGSSQQVVEEQKTELEPVVEESVQPTVVEETQPTEPIAEETEVADVPAVTEPVDVPAATEPVDIPAASEPAESPAVPEPIDIQVSDVPVEVEEVHESEQAEEHETADVVAAPVAEDVSAPAGTAKVEVEETASPTTATEAQAEEMLSSMPEVETADAEPASTAEEVTTADPPVAAPETADVTEHVEAHEVSESAIEAQPEVETTHEAEAVVSENHAQVDNVAESNEQPDTVAAISDVPPVEQTIPIEEEAVSETVALKEEVAEVETSISPNTLPESEEVVSSEPLDTVEPIAASSEVPPVVEEAPSAQENVAETPTETLQANAEDASVPATNEEAKSSFEQTVVDHTEQVDLPQPADEVVSPSVEIVQSSSEEVVPEEGKEVTESASQTNVLDDGEVKVVESHDEATLEPASPPQPEDIPASAVESAPAPVEDNIPLPAEDSNPTPEEKSTEATEPVAEESVATKENEPTEPIPAEGASEHDVINATDKEGGSETIAPPASTAEVQPSTEETQS